MQCWCKDDELIDRSEGKDREIKAGALVISGRERWLSNKASTSERVFIDEMVIELLPFGLGGAGTRSTKLGLPAQWGRSGTDNYHTMKQRPWAGRGVRKAFLELKLENGVTWLSLGQRERKVCWMEGPPELITQHSTATASLRIATAQRCEARRD